MKRVSANTLVPKVPWKYVNPEDGFAISDSYFNRLKQNVIVYRQANHYPIGLLFGEQFEENLCEHAPEQQCFEFVPPTALEKMTAVAKALYHASLQWRGAVVSTEEVERRRNICGECNFFGGSKSPLKIACKKCGCTGLKLFLSSQHCPLPQPKW